MQNNANFLEACRLGSLDWATELLKGGANIEHRDQVHMHITPYIIACVNVLCVQVTGNQALHYASELEHKSIIEFLLTNGADPNSKNNVYSSLLQCMVLYLTQLSLHAGWYNATSLPVLTPVGEG